jgi:hypothetical protein
MMQKKKVTKTNLEIPVKPVSDRPMTEEEYMAKVADIKKQRQVQATLDKVADEVLAQRTPRGPVQRTQQRRPAPRHVQPQPIRGLLAPEPTPKGFMGLLATTPKGSKG